MEERLFRQRSILIYDEINLESSRDTTKQFLALAADSDKDIKIFINSQGGHVDSGFALYDLIRSVKNTVKVIGIGWVVSAGALIYVAPPVEHRYSLPNTRFMIHQPLGSVSGSARDYEIEATELLRIKRRLIEVLSAQTGQPMETIEKDTERNRWMSAGEAKEYGIVGHVAESIADL